MSHSLNDRLVVFDKINDYIVTTFYNLYAVDKSDEIR